MDNHNIPIDDTTAQRIVDGTKALRDEHVKTPFYTFMLTSQAKVYLASVGMAYVEGQELYLLPDSAIPECTLIVQDTIPGA